jgi:hypothetical protein
MKLRAVFWTLSMAYTGFLLASQGVPSFNSLTISEGLLGGLTGFLLSIMFTLRAIRRQRPALIAHSIAHMMPDSGISPQNRGSRPKLRL